ncbi:Histidine kinase [Chitinophaga sp. CF118]|uniref:sensor histidine kinase n=1 Tax=Chitinophaga sp. CF118 TaxID=1884367 RepID=UPI0008EFC622|nr:histidine kinase [Chitinophaga sp. CF118]SFD98203.1 Histidine kinase [Chitinophaga sp. CF118]
MFKKIKGGGITTHIFFLLLFLVVPILVFPRPPGEPLFILNRPFVQDTIANGMLLCFFYLNYYIFIPRFFFNHKYIVYTSCVILSLIIAFEFPHLIVTHLLKMDMDLPEFHTHIPRPLHNRSPFFFLFDEMRRHLYLFFTATFFSFLLRTREHLSQLKEEKLKAELSSLKSQINPHFLFNTLNSIYVLSVMKDNKASDAIIHLAGLMRYVIKDANDYKIPLQKEIDYIRNYIELQKARLGNTTYVRFECSGEPGSKEITPLILITYIENAFKYGINPDVDDCIVEITLQVTDTGIRLYVFNKKVQVPYGTESTGIGMSNTRERLKHIYPERHNLQISENKETYSVTLSLQLI